MRQDYDYASHRDCDLIQIPPTSGATPEADKYQPLGTELQKNDGKSKIAVRNTADCCKRENTADRRYTRNYMINGNIKLTMYNIEGHNYFKMREIAYALDFSLEWEQASGRIQIDTARRYSFTPYKAELQENSVEIGSVYEFEKPVFISEMPIIAYRVETTEPEKSESQMLRLKEYPAMKHIYLAAEDLDNYGFDVINEESGNTLNPSKAIGMMDGELVNSRVRTERVSPLYPAKKHVMMNGVEVFSTAWRIKP